MKIQFRILVLFLTVTAVVSAVTFLSLAFTRDTVPAAEVTSKESTIVAKPICHVETIETKPMVATKSEEVVEETSEPTKEYKFNDEELYIIDILARTIYSEAGDQSYEGMVAVGQVVRNRW